MAGTVVFHQKNAAASSKVALSWAMSVASRSSMEAAVILCSIV
jgi:hypothetical protein